MGRRLAEHLESLKIEDGSPDKTARRAALNGLIPHLTTSEIQELRLQLNAVVIPNDICTKFPPELVQNIAKHLELEELIRARHVCRSWNRHFGSPELSVEFIKWHFPFIWERDFKDIKKNELPIDQLGPHYLLLRQAEKHIRRKRGMFHSISMYQVLKNAPSPPEPHTIGRQNRELQLQYCKGRVAYSTDRRQGVTVKDLRSQTTTAYMDENRRYLADWLLSDTLLLITVDNRNTLLGWRLDDYKHGTPSTLRFPSPIQTISALYDRVGVVTTAHEVLIWAFGGPMQQVNLGDSRRLMDGLNDDSRIDFGRVFFHPLKDNVFFVVFLILGDGSRGKERAGRVAVLQCSQRSWNIPTHRIQRSDNDIRTPNLSISQVDRKYSGLGPASKSAPPQDRAPYSLRGPTDSVLAAIDKNNSDGRFRWYKKDLDSAQQMSEIFGVRIYPTDINSWFAHGDDDFVVVAGYRGFVVWCFDKDVVLPTE
ncbi:uncharacterized protein PAC_03753 [Phialocephala subalpina]|uniref:F-box domain-containing protein n=1 Tax=Phialocephala subalpina TaxID=576137 RepID=A0A1L7WM65_9HELO|nr:uncharacterized protein PAC_03753 [Phialocephala subalpina]